MTKQPSIVSPVFLPVSLAIVVASAACRRPEAIRAATLHDERREHTNARPR